LSEDPDSSWPVADAAALGRAVAYHRRQAGLTQAELATLAGINRQYLSELENGRATEQTERIFRVLRRLGLRLSVEAR
jgi:transcriptional regulator with XRE-family HTH domain